MNRAIDVLFISSILIVFAAPTVGGDFAAPLAIW